MKHCILNVADGEFRGAQERLKESLLGAAGYRGDLQLWTDTFPPGSPTQDQSPMAFKPFAFQHAFTQGYDVALWLDASMIAVRSVTPLLARAASVGVYLWGNGASCGEWASDDILERFDISRERSFQVEEIVSCVVGISNRHPTGRQFLAEWLERARDGSSFRGVPPGQHWSSSRTNADGQVSRDPRVKGHRWDQTAASLIAHRLRIPIAHLDCTDVIHYANNTWAYVPDIPLTVRLLQNRDFKAGVLGSAERWGGPGAWRRAARLPRRLVKTAKACVRSILIRWEVRRRQ